MLIEDQILKNKEKFISLLRQVKREGANIEALIKKLESKGFFEAPASSKYHSNYRGGLCQHSLNVFDNAMIIAQKVESAPLAFLESLKESIIITALLHDISKMGFYEEYTKPVFKGYDQTGRKVFDDESGYKIRDSKNRYIFGSHSQNSERMVSYYIPLNDEESAAIIWHMGGADDFKCPDLSVIYNNYSLAAIIHAADFIATYLNERIQ